jgi:catechol 2,3-dioxygenase-like lactoylglutathione lyase family enzyme
MGYGVIPAIRVLDVAASLEFYVDRLGFVLERGDASAENCAISRGDARLMLEVAGDLYSDGYNRAIRDRLGGRSATALYIEAPDLDPLYAAVEGGDVELVDPIADRSWGQREFTIADPDGTWLTFWRVLGAG